MLVLIQLILLLIVMWLFAGILAFSVSILIFGGIGYMIGAHFSDNWAIFGMLLGAGIALRGMMMDK